VYKNKIIPSHKLFNSQLLKDNKPANEWGFKSNTDDSIQSLNTQNEENNELSQKMENKFESDLKDKEFDMGILNKDEKQTEFGFEKSAHQEILNKGEILDVSKKHFSFF